MICPKCGKEYGDGVEACPYCNTGLSSDVQAGREAAHGVTKAPRKRNPAIIVALVVIIAAIVGYAYLHRSGTVKFETLVPETAGMVGVSDANWWWNASKDVRGSAAVAKAMQESEKQLGISCDKDVVPWMGQIGCALLGMTGTEPQVVVLGEVKDVAAFNRFVSKAQKAASTKGHMKWTQVDYHGVKLQESEFTAPPRRNAFGVSAPKKTTVAVGLLGKWFVLGIGKGSAQKVVDTWQHKTPSIEHNEKWTKALAELKKMPGKHVGWVGYDCESYMKAMLGANPMMATMCKVPEAAKVTAVCAFTESASELKVDSVAIPNSEKARAIYKAFAQSKPLTGKAFNELPSETFAVMVSTLNGEKTVDFLKQYILDMFANPQVKAQVEMGFGQAQPIFSALKSFTGESAAAFTWKDGIGFGGVLLGETSGAANAKATAGDLQAFAQVTGATVKVDNGLVMIPQTKHDTKNLHVMLCWGAKNEWFKLSSHPGWLTTPGKSKLQLPSEAKNAAIAGVGDFSFLPSVLKWAKSESKSKADHDVIEMLSKLGLEKAQWAFWSEFDDETGMVRNTTVLRNWEWRKSIKPMMDYSAKQAETIQ